MFVRVSSVGEYTTRQVGRRGLALPLRLPHGVEFYRLVGQLSGNARTKRRQVIGIGLYGHQEGAKEPGHSEHV